MRVIETLCKQAVEPRNSTSSGSIPILVYLSVIYNLNCSSAELVLFRPAYTLYKQPRLIAQSVFYHVILINSDTAKLLFKPPQFWGPDNFDTSD